MHIYRLYGEKQQYWEIICYKPHGHLAYEMNPWRVNINEPPLKARPNRVTCIGGKRDECI